MITLIFATLVLVVVAAVVATVVVGDLVDRRRKRLAEWTARTLVGMYTSEVQIQLVYRTKRNREYVMKRQQVGSVLAAQEDHDDEIARLMTKARARAFEMNIGEA